MEVSTPQDGVVSGVGVVTVTVSSNTYVATCVPHEFNNVSFTRILSRQNVPDVVVVFTT
jgi:hypothetical protein